MKLEDCQSVRQVGNWLQQHGLSPGENRFFGGVHDVHSDTSMHYRRGTKESGVRDDLQGDLALDVNDRDVRDTAFYRLRRGQWRAWRPQSEHEALMFAYNKILKVALAKRWPLEEVFFDGKGSIIEEEHRVNHPITGHDGHMHAAWYRFYF